MRHEPHVEFIPFPDPEPVAEPEAVVVDSVADDAVTPDAVTPDAAADSPETVVETGDDPQGFIEPEPEPEPAPATTSSDEHIVPDQVLAPDEPVVLLGEGGESTDDHADQPSDGAAWPIAEQPDASADIDATAAAHEAPSDISDGGVPSDGEHAEPAIDLDVIDVRGQDAATTATTTATTTASADDDDDADRPLPATVRSAESAGAIVAARRSTGRRHTDQLAMPPEPEPSEPVSGTFRRWGISGRMLFLPMAAIVVAVLIALVATWGIGSITQEARQMAAAGTATAAAAELRVLLAEVRDTTGPVEPDRLDTVAGSATATAVAASGQADPARIDGLVEATDRLVEASRGGAGEVEVGAQAITAIGTVDEVTERIEAARLDRLDRLDQRRVLTIVAMLVVLLVGSLVVLALTRSVAMSIVGPLRSLGRSMRRFADGDTSSRGVEGVDEVGLLARSFNYSASAMGQRIDRLSADAARGAQLRMISDALDLADDETDVYRIAERALSIVAPGLAAEVMVHDSTSTRLVEVAANAQFGSPGCPVDTSAGCVAMRRAQAVVFDSPSSINSCPYLRDRDTACSAACVPVSVNGHLLGVVHVTGPEYDPPAPEIVEQLVTLGGQIGTRIGAMRTLEVSRLQASTDGLTGLANRRMLEARLADFMRTDTPFVLAVADLDRFTEINNNYGHEFGDRALQLFAGVLEENVRDRDIVARFGGEEFVLVYPQMSVKPSMEAIERIRGALARELERHDFPEFTCSFGVTHSSVGDSVEAIIRVADAGLLTAKELGRNRVVYADEDLAVGVFGNGNDASGSASRAFSSTQRERAEPAESTIEATPESTETPVSEPQPTPDPG